MTRPLQISFYSPSAEVRWGRSQGLGRKGQVMTRNAVRRLQSIGPSAILMAESDFRLASVMLPCYNDSNLYTDATRLPQV